jgi:cytochrome c peroxidase
MKQGFVILGTAVALVSFSACSGDAKTPAAPPAPQSGPAAPSAAAPAAKSDSAAPNPAAQNPSPGPRKPVAGVRVDLVLAKALFGNPPASPAVDNPVTPEKVALGKLLYHDESLSKNGNMSCATCHDLGNYGQDGKPTSPGSDGKNGERNTPTVWNAFRQFAQFWDGRAATVEEQAIMPVLNPIEHGVKDEAELVSKMKAKPELVAAFGKAFTGADPVTAQNFSLAIGAFERTLVTKSRFETFLEGDQAALTNDEKAGFNKFMEVGCQACHMGSLFGGGMYQKTGVYKAYPSEDVGRAAVTKNDADKFLFKVPSLLNVEKTAPYYHDGKIATLEEAVANMAEIQLGKNLKPEEVSSIVTFLKTLTGPLPQLN